MVSPDQALSQMLPLTGRYDLSVYGANGFYRHFKGEAADHIDSTPRYDAATESFILVLTNSGNRRATLAIADGYGLRSHQMTLAPGASAEFRQSIAASDHWYDLTVTARHRDGFRRQFAGHIETGRASKSDPAIGRA